MAGIRLSDRSQYIAAHVTWGVRDALKAEAQRQGVSVSKYVSDAVERALRDAGCDLSAEVDRGEPLPFPTEETPA